jgi:long-chain acyl-CoA synthetase
MAPAALQTRRRVFTGNIARLDFDNYDHFGTYTRLYFEDRRYTNLEELVYSGQLARLLKDYGVGAGDRVMVVSPNSPDLTALFQAVWMAGAVMVPVMPHWTAAEIVPVLRSAEPKAVVTIPAAAGKLQAALSAAGTSAHFLVCGASDVPGAGNLHSLVSPAPALESPVDRSPDDLALLLYTSGTTAAPKGAMLTHGNIFAAFESAFRLNGELPRGPALLTLPLSHSFGLLMLNLSYGWGFTAVLLSQFDPLRVFEAIENHQVQYMSVVPTMLVYLLGHPARERFRLTSVRRITSGGAALPEQVRTDFERMFGARIDQGYGLSETVAVATGYADDDPYRPGSAGRPAPGVRLRIAGSGGEALPPQSPGEIWVSGDHVMTGYWQDAEATSAALIDGWLRTGDIGYTDEDGYLYITDRKKDLIIKGGENVSPREIEEALHLHPAVAAAAVVGIADSVFGENICAVTQLKPGAFATEAEIQAHVERYVTRFKVPAQVLFWPELPRNYTGKISKRDIRDRLRESSATV